MFQIILTGGIFRLAGKTGLEQISAMSPSRWGFAAVASTANLNAIQQPPGQQAAAHVKPASRPARAQHHAGGRHHAGGHHHAGGSSSPGPPRISSSVSSAASAGGPSVVTDPIWAHTSATWLRDVGLMAALGLLFSLLAWWRILRIKPGRRR